MTTITFDIEATDLLRESSINYLSSPYKLKDSFSVHCIVVEEHETGDILAFYDGATYVLDGREYSEKMVWGHYTLKDYSPIQYIHKPMKDFAGYVRSGKVKKVIAHNGINYDLLVCKLYFGLDYTVEEDSWAGQEVTIEDTMVTSKTLNPDRFGGHSLDNLGKKVGLHKIEFRKKIPVEDRFKEFAADMLYYCIRDVKVNTKIYHWLEKEKLGWDWRDALSLEKSVAEIITRQEHRGFKFDKNLAESNILKLDLLMKERRDRVTPLLPRKPATKAFMKDYTPPVRQFLQSGKASSYLIKFAEKLGAVIEENEEGLAKKFIYNGITYKLPLPLDPLVTEQDADIDDSTHIKNWLVGLGWSPSEYKEKDLTHKQVKGVGKVKRTQEEYEKALNTYLEQTMNCNFKQDRIDHIKTYGKSFESCLLNKDIRKSVKVLTNPSFTVGQEKEICPNLEKFKGSFPYVSDVVEYLTYKHRRNSILGGGVDWEDEEEADKGYMAYVREDGRIPTPADTCGAATSRFKHRVVANIPRLTSLFGGEMRALFGVDEAFYQMGYDFDSLEARMESHYCYTYDKDKEYCNSLLLEKPNDVHSQMAKKISAIIKRDFGRSPAKSVKYAATYGATAPKIAKTIGSDAKTGEIVFEAFWEAALPLKKLKERLQRYWEDIGGKQFILGIDGRKVPTRSQHAILNSLFQSAGVICAKRAMVIMDRLIKGSQLHIDFFKDDWQQKEFCAQLCAYHDEAQSEVSKGLVKFKTFRYEDSLDVKESEGIHKRMKALVQGKKDQLQKDGSIWSDISHTDTHYYIAHSIVGEIASRAVKLAGEYYKLKVDLTAGYVIGRNWAECH